MIKKWKKIGSERVFRGKKITVRDDSFVLPNGKKHKSEIVEYPDAASVVAVNNGKIIFVRQYRPAFDKVCLEIPGGKVDKNEPVKRAALRELEEETGYRAGKLKKLASFRSWVQLARIHYIFFATNLKQGKQNFDPLEFIDVVALTPQQAMKKISTGEIIDSDSIIGILFAKEKGLI